KRIGEDPIVSRRRTASVATTVLVWLALTAGLAATGLLRRFEATPPPFAVLMLAVFVLGAAVALSPLGALLLRGVPLWALVGFQVFRFPLELVMHRAYTEGVMPVQMSYSGRNDDILSGITAGLLGLWLFRRRAARWVIAAWNLLGL